MASMAMAQAVLEHAHQFYDVDNWYVVAECWDTWAVLEELDQHEEKTKVPFMLIAGGDDRDSGAVSFRYRDGSQRNGVPIEEAVEFVRDWVASRRNDDPKAPTESPDPVA